MTLPKAMAILGPTASGKTQLALDIAQHFPVEIISLDSALVYRDMDIGTAKPSSDEMAQAPHHLINIISPMESYSAANFCQDTLKLIDEIHARNHLPLIVGGTMMYYNALTQGLNNLPEADIAIRQQLAQQKAEHGLSYLYDELKKIDPITARRLQANDSQRIERALEVYMLTKIPMSEHLSQQTQQAAVDLLCVTLIPEDRKKLHLQIAKRFDLMIKAGFVDEVKNLQQKYPELTADSTSMRCVGYRQAWDYLAGNDNMETFIEKGIISTRQLAKRQLTWLRKLNSDKALDPYQEKDLFQAAKPLLNKHFFG